MIGCLCLPSSNLGVGTPEGSLGPFSLSYTPIIIFCLPSAVWLYWCVVTEAFIPQHTICSPWRGSFLKGNCDERNMPSIWSVISQPYNVSPIMFNSIFFNSNSTQFHLVNFNSTSNLSIPNLSVLNLPISFLTTLFAMSRYSEYLLRVPIWKNYSE